MITNARIIIAGVAAAAVKIRYIKNMKGHFECPNDNKNVAEDNTDRENT